MTIVEAQRRGDCRDCAWRLVGPGPMQCMAAQVGESECPGQCDRENRKNEQQQGD